MKKAKILGHMVIVFVCVAATVTAHHLWTTVPILTVRVLRVHAPSEALAAEVRNLAQPALGVSLYRVNLRELSDRIGRHPRVRSVATRRILPGTIQIDVQLRQAVAWFSWRAKRYGIDEEGVVFPSLESEPRGDRKDSVPISMVAFDPPTSSAPDHATVHVLASRVALLLRQHQECGQPGGPVTHIRVRPLGRLLVTLQRGVEVDVGGADFDAAWRRVKGVFSNVMNAAPTRRKSSEKAEFIGINEHFEEDFQRGWGKCNNLKTCSKHVLPRLSGIGRLYIPLVEDSSPETECDRVIIKQENSVKRTGF